MTCVAPILLLRSCKRPGSPRELHAEDGRLERQIVKRTVKLLTFTTDIVQPVIQRSMTLKSITTNGMENAISSVDSVETPHTSRFYTAVIVENILIRKMNRINQALSLFPDQWYGPIHLVDFVLLQN